MRTTKRDKSTPSLHDATPSLSAWTYFQLALSLLSLVAIVLPIVLGGPSVWFWLGAGGTIGLTLMRFGSLLNQELWVTQYLWLFPIGLVGLSLFLDEPSIAVAGFTALVLTRLDLLHRIRGRQRQRVVGKQ